MEKKYGTKIARTIETKKKNLADSHYSILMAHYKVLSLALSPYSRRSEKYKFMTAKIKLYIYLHFVSKLTEEMVNK